MPDLLQIAWTRGFLKRLKVAATNVAAASPVLEKLTGLNAELAWREAEALAPMVRGMLAKNFDDSGLKSHTGQLRRTLYRAYVGFNSAGIFVGYEGGLTRAEDKRPEAAYIIASSLQYGSVRSGALLRGVRRAKKGLKEAALLHIGNKRSVQIGKGLRVTRPRPFFLLTRGQGEEILRAFSKRLQAALKAG